MIGRFLSVDPVAADPLLGANFNRYWYANNSPYKFTDPDGRLAFCLIPLGPMQACAAVGSAALKGILFVGSAALAGYAGSEVLNEMNESAEEGGSSSDEGTRELGDLETIHSPDHPQNDSGIGDLTDDELGDAINNPADGQKVKVRGNRVLDGNTRINEARDRGWPSDTPIPVEELPELPDNVDEDPLGPYRDI